MSLVFTEFIELNFCGLQKFTRSNIEKRALSEISLKTQRDINNDFRDSSLDPMNDEEENEFHLKKKLIININI